MIYLYDELDNITYDNYLKICNINKKKPLKKLKYDDNLKHQLCVFLLKIYLYNNNESDLFDTFCYLKNGRPVIDNYFISFSRCKKGIIFGISKNEIGVDIESFITNYVLEKNIFLSEKEIELVKKSKDYVFFINCKEAFLKSIGLGITDEIYKLDFSNYYKKRNFKKDNFKFYFENKSNYSYSICYKDKIKIKKLTYEDIGRYLYEFEKEKV